jgi:hypothetical protein
MLLFDLPRLLQNLISTQYSKHILQPGQEPSVLVRHILLEQAAKPFPDFLEGRFLLTWVEFFHKPHDFFNELVRCVLSFAKYFHRTN